MHQQRVAELSKYLEALFDTHGAAISASKTNTLFKRSGADDSDLVKLLMGPPLSAQCRVELHEDPVVQLKVMAVLLFACFIALLPALDFYR